MRSLLPLLAACSSLALAACGSDVSQPSSASTGAGGAPATSSGNSVSGAGGAGMGGGSMTTAGSAMGGGSTTAATGSAGSTASVTSSGSSSGSSSSTGSPTCPSIGDVCPDCVSVKCPDTFCGCYGNLACQALDACLLSCAMGDTACQQQCLTANKDGISAIFLVDDCAATLCGAECPYSKTITPCQKCLFTKCDIQMNNCLANAECSALIACVKACGADAACKSGCVSAHPNGAQDAQGVSFCLNANCGGICP